ncbi:flavin reductase [Bacteroidales bacterium OttesenSCG-928-I21]|nr:flavin reductase [Bacteroidales bacterium OttesenSCG-928-I21]
MKKNIKIINPMKRFIYTILVLFVISCSENNNKKNEYNEQVSTKKETNFDIKDKNFEELFYEIKPEDFNENVFSLFKKAAVLTSGNESDFNSMTIGWGGWGQHFGNPATWCYLRANRYTLEYIKKYKQYTITFFDDCYHDQIMHFGNSSGRDTDKMGTHELHSVFTPSNNATYKEANIIIECTLMEISTVNPEDFYLDANRNFIVKAYEEAGDYHKIVFGQITNIWIKK